MEGIFFGLRSGSGRDKFHLRVGNSFLGEEMVGGLIPDNFIDLKWEKDRNSWNGNGHFTVSSIVK